MKIYNSLTKTKEEIQPADGQTIKFYSCGPTTYDYLHIGNGRALIVGDMIYRALKFLGYHVFFVRNFTDVDDKIIQRSLERGVSPKEHAEEFVQECLSDMQSLNLSPADKQPKVTETIPEIIQMIQELIRHGSAYEVDGEVLFHVPSYPHYGELSRLDWEGMEHGHRVEVQKHKKHPSDFVLWKPDKGEGVFWDSPWGKGRPGWHIECSAMAKKYLGETIDLHHGGIDLLFPHHENEMAQSVCANQKEFCKFWCHHEFVNFQQEKMSKSLGNVVTIRQFIQEYSGLTLRYLFSMSHYRTKVDWTEHLVQQAHRETIKIQQYLVDWKSFSKNQTHKHSQKNLRNDLSHEFVMVMDQHLKKIQQDLADDLNMPMVLSSFYAVWKMIRKATREMEEWTSEMLMTVEDWIQKSDLLLGLYSSDPQRFLLEQRQNMQKKETQRLLDPEEVDDLISKRAKAKEEKNWPMADSIRKALKEKGVLVKDHPDGTTTWDWE